MKCPHCGDNFFFQANQQVLINDKEHIWEASSAVCPACGKAVIFLNQRLPSTRQLVGTPLVYPRVPARAPIPREIPDEFADDYKEACLVLSDSPKASAALSRRCLQHILREKAGVKAGNLADEIEQAMQGLPTHLANAVDGVRNIGNFAAHPMKNTHTGEIVDVEPGEAEWLLEVLEQLLDFYFVQPERLKVKRTALNKKLAGAGKPPVK